MPGGSASSPIASGFVQQAGRTPLRMPYALWGVTEKRMKENVLLNRGVPNQKALAGMSAKVVEEWR
jgi:hypothetical protein